MGGVKRVVKVSGAQTMGAPTARISGSCGGEAAAGTIQRRGSSGGSELTSSGRALVRAGRGGSDLGGLSSLSSSNSSSSSSSAVTTSLAGGQSSIPARGAESGATPSLSQPSCQP